MLRHSLQHGVLRPSIMDLKPVPARQDAGVGAVTHVADNDEMIFTSFAVVLAFNDMPDTLIPAADIATRPFLRVEPHYIAALALTHSAWYPCCPLHQCLLGVQTLRNRRGGSQCAPHGSRNA